MDLERQAGRKYLPSSVQETETGITSSRCCADGRWESWVSDSLQECSSSSSRNTEEFWETDLRKSGERSL